MQIFLMLVFMASMLLVGWIIWRFVSEREEQDPRLQKMLDDDDRRAAIGRGEKPADES